MASAVVEVKRRSQGETVTAGLNVVLRAVAELGAENRAEWHVNNKMRTGGVDTVAL